MNVNNFLKDHRSKPTYRVLVRDNTLVGFSSGGYFLDEGHISLEDDLIVIQGLTCFPGHLTPWGAIKWGLSVWWKRLNYRAGVVFNGRDRCEH